MSDKKRRLFSAFKKDHSPVLPPAPSASLPSHLRPLDTPTSYFPAPMPDHRKPFDVPHYSSSVMPDFLRPFDSDLYPSQPETTYPLMPAAATPTSTASILQTKSTDTQLQPEDDPDQDDMRVLPGMCLPDYERPLESWAPPDHLRLLSPIEPPSEGSAAPPDPLRLLEPLVLLPDPSHLPAPCPPPLDPLRPVEPFVLLPDPPHLQAPCAPPPNHLRPISPIVPSVMPGSALPPNPLQPLVSIPPPAMEESRVPNPLRPLMPCATPPNHTRPLMSPPLPSDPLQSPPWTDINEKDETPVLTALGRQITASAKDHKSKIPKFFHSSRDSSSSSSPTNIPSPSPLYYEDPKPVPVEHWDSPFMQHPLAAHDRLFNPNPFVEMNVLGDPNGNDISTSILSPKRHRYRPEPTIPLHAEDPYIIARDPYISARDPYISAGGNSVIPSYMPVPTYQSAPPNPNTRLDQWNDGKDSMMAFRPDLPVSVDTPAPKHWEKGRIRRWYLQQTNDGNYGKLDMEPQPPITLEADNCWNFKLDKGDIESGWYSIVCCVVFKTIPETIKSLIIDPKQFDDNKRSVYSGKTCKTVAGYDELSQIPLGTPTRLRLHRQMEVQEKGYIDLSIKLESETPQDFELHYVELVLGQKQTPEEIVIYGEGKPEQVIHVHHDTNNGSSPQKTLSVHAFDTSFNGSYAATLCFDEDQKKAIFDIWSLYDPAKQGTPRTSKLLARGAINAVPSAHADFADICLSVSDSGTTVVVHSQEATNGIPCHVMSYSPFVPIDSDFASQTWVLTKQSMCETLTGFFGYGNFHYTSIVNPHLKDERYITFDGKSVCVYNTVGAWTRIRTIHLGHDLNLAAGVSLVPSLRGRYFAWTGAQGIVSVWDFETGSQVSHIKVESDALGAFVNLSRDGALVVVSSKSAISVFETHSGVKLGEYQQGLGDNNYFEVVPEGEHIMILDGMSEDDSNDIVSRKIVSTRDMSITRTFQVHKDYDVRFPLACCSSHMLTYRQGSVVNIVKADNSLISAPKKTFEPESVTDMSVDLHASKTTWEYTSHSGTTFTMSTTISVIHGNWMSILSMTCQSDSSESLALPVGSSHLAYPSIFFPESSRLVMLTGRYLQIWRLEGGTSLEQFELELVWVLQEEDEVRHPSSDICVRNIRCARGNTSGTQIELSLTSPAWFRRLRRLPDDPYERNEATITIPVSESDTLSISEEYRVRQGIRGVVDMYMNGDSKCQKRAIQYLRTLVRPCSANPISCIVTLCRLWKSGEKTYFEQIMSDLLPVDKITWVPNTNGDESANPLAILIKRAETEPNTIGVAKVIMEYCVSHANSARNLSFLAPIFESMNDVMTLFPHEALQCLSRIAFIPVKERSYVIDNHTIVHPPRVRLDFWRTYKKPLYKTKDPIMHLNVSPKKPDPSNDKFTHPVFMASFDALWFYHSKEAKFGHSGATGSRTTEWTPPTIDEPDQPAEVKKATRSKSLLFTLLHSLNPIGNMYVECYDFNLEFFDNPAIAALVDYKWNTIGFTYWLVRFVCQCVYYILILFAALMQVYHSDSILVLVGVFVAITTMAAIFIWLEILQALQSWSKYKGSSYNLVDLLAFVIPMAASIQQLVIIYKDDPHGNSRILSFSVLVVFIHMLFELRINKNVCKYVSIIQQAIVEIQVFFFIFASGIVAFTISMLHMLRACPVGNGGCASPADAPGSTEGPNFPRHFFGALSATYFFMGGRYDSVSDELDSTDWAFHLMMMIFFFFTVILMLNVLIALINVAFTKGDDGWRLAWVESRLRYIELAENMSYQIPGFRETYNCFPKEIYFTATARQVKEYQQKHGITSTTSF